MYELDELVLDEKESLIYKPWKRRYSQKFNRLKIDQMYPKMQYRRNTYTYMVNDNRNLFHNCKKTAIRMLQARLPEGQPIQVCYQKRTRVDLITIYLDNRMKHQVFSHKGVGAWLNLTNYLKRFVDYVDI